MHPSLISEAICWMYNQRPELVDAMIKGGQELRNLCKVHSIEYKAIFGHIRNKIRPVESSPRIIMVMPETILGIINLLCLSYQLYYLCYVNL